MILYIYCWKTISHNVVMYNHNLSLDGCVTTPTHTLCLAYDEGMMEHFSYDDETHPERPERISCIFQRLQEFGIVGRCHHVKVTGH